MKDEKELADLVSKLGGEVKVSDKLGVSRQTVWDQVKVPRSTRKVYLYALRYLYFLPSLVRTKAFRDYVKNDPDK